MKEHEITLEELKQGYIRMEHGFSCIQCDAFFADEEVYPVAGRYLLASAAVKHHIEECHGGSFQRLLQMDKKENSLTDVQRTLFQYLKEGKSDKVIANLTNTSPSTIRHQRFIFKEKAKQAKIYLALYELAMAQDEDSFLSIHKTAKQVDERFIATDKEAKQVLETMFSSLNPLRLKQFPAKEKKKIIVLREIMKGFSSGRRYSEQEINAYLKAIFEDFATLRRYLIEYGYLDRTQDCKEYWVKEA